MTIFEAVHQHAPMLTVLVPMLSAPIIMLFGNRQAAFAIALTASTTSFLLSLQMLLLVAQGGVISYHIGGWAPPLGIEYRIDAANAFVLIIVSSISTVVLPYARRSIADEVAARHHTLFYACYMLCFTGLLGVTATGDAFNVFVFLEISSLSTYVLVALGAKQDRRALSAAYDYLILGTIGATFFVIGLGMLYMATGSLNMVHIAQVLAEGESNRTVRSAFTFIVVGMALKFAMYPLHRWLPGAYTYAPSAVSAFLAATATKVAIYVVLRFIFSVFGIAEEFERNTVQYIMMPLAVVAMFAGSLMATFSLNAKTLLAYSSISQIGYMLLGITLLNSTGLTAGMVHLFNHALTKGALFLAVGAIIYRTGSALVPHMAGLGRQMPWTSASIVIGGLSLIGAPATAGFVSKWVLMQAAFEAGMWPIAVFVVLSSVIAVVYVWRLVEVLYLQPAPEGRSVSEVPMTMLVPIWALALASIWFGIDADFTVQASRTAAEALLAGGFGGEDATIMGTRGRP
ncbi:MAG: monovalent cation/H+ antiporter subunit D family protein [Ahrensia sp.]|nr:monovalent cation/H+ antiporter subunit D family protein [Ahrensia sp.]